MDDVSSPTGREPALAAVPSPDGSAPRALVLGATGYIGGRLVPRLLNAGYDVRVLARDPARVAAFAWGDRVEVAVPGGETSTTVPYSIVDGRGGRATAFLTVEGSADAPLLAPIARDDVLETADVLGRATVDVPVLDNDEDPDGTRGDLALAVHPTAAAAAQVVGDQLRVTVGATRQVLAYSVTSPETT